jgi:hypothetical protein
LIELIKDNREIIFEETRNQELRRNIITLLNEPITKPLMFANALKLIKAFLEFKDLKIKKHQTSFAF